jgi:Ca2+:H+ antiporter
LALIAALLPIVLLSKTLATYVNYGIAASGAPLTLGGFLVAALILTPEALSAIQAARDNLLQRAVNICLGSGLATIGLTIPAVLTIGWITGEKVELGLGMTDIVLLALTLVVSLTTFVSQRTNALQGAVHLALFACYVIMIFDTVK